MAQVASGDVVTILNTTYFTTDKVPFMVTTNYQPFCPSDIFSCLAAGKCKGSGAYNEFFYTIDDVQNIQVPYSYALYNIVALQLESSTSNAYVPMAVGTKIYAGMLVGFQSALNLSYLQTGPSTGAISFDDRIQLQGSSWSDNDGNAFYRVFMFVSETGDGQDGNVSTVPVNYGSPFFIQSLGKLINNKNQQYWKVGDPKYDCAVSTQDVKSLPRGNENYLFYIYDENGGGAPIVYSQGGLPIVQWVFIGIIVLLGIIAIILIIVLILWMKKKSDRKKAAQQSVPTEQTV